MSDIIIKELKDSVLTITINRPKTRNAINYEAAQQLGAALDYLDQTPEAVIGVITGAEGSFCSGMDLKAFAASEHRPYVEGKGFAGICEKPPLKPIIAAVEGYALGGGCEIALACDMIVAAKNANFGLPETKRGLVPGAGGMLRFPTRVPYHIAMEAILTGNMFSAKRAEQFGLVNHLVEPDQALNKALELAKTIAANGPLAVQAAKQVIQQSRGWPQEHMFDLQRPLIAHILSSADAKEGATAFAEKRAPVWQGK